MEESKIALPSWLPWATTAILAALVACVGELWLIEKSRTQLLRDETALSASALKSVQNQLEAEQIVSSRELSELRQGLSVEVLSSPTAGPGRLYGAVVWNPSSPQAILTLFKLPKRQDTGVYQLWMIDAAPGAQRPPLMSGEYPASGISGNVRMNVGLISPQSTMLRFVFIYCKKAGAQTLREARSRGSIVLASPSWDGTIPNP
jgi:hypothetical protein